LTNDDRLRDAADGLTAIDHQKARILMEAEREFQAAKDADEFARAKNTLIAAIRNGPRYHPYLVPKPLTDEMIDDAFDDLLTPNAWKAKMIPRLKPGSEQSIQPT
jgi:hypothetical protein